MAAPTVQLAGPVADTRPSARRRALRAAFRNRLIFVGLALALIFILVAFAGSMDAGSLARVVIAQWLVKSAYETLATPLTYAVVRFLKKTEREDFYDHQTNFNPFRLKD